MKSIHKSRNRFIILSLVVPVILLLIFVVYPSVDLVAMSFTSWDGVSPERPFNGIRNYIEMFTKSPDLWLSLQQQLYLFGRAHGDDPHRAWNRRDAEQRL